MSQFLMVPVEYSARHIHLSKETINLLFGENYSLTVKKNLSQPGHFAAEETVTLVGPKNSLKLRILGPERDHDQVELAKSDCLFVGIDAPLRLSGDVHGSAGGKLIGPAGEVELKEGVIIAKRHWHCSAVSAEKYQLKNGDKVSVVMEGERALLFDEVIIRVHESSDDTIHLDTDEANAAGLQEQGKLCKVFINR
ncbi:MAG TPA: phosphate propanoyltransferase [bacterium]|nr:phosphate propanoyltransferase [bacterium]